MGILKYLERIIIGFNGYHYWNGLIVALIATPIIHLWIFAIKTCQIIN